MTEPTKLQKIADIPPDIAKLILDLGPKSQAGAVLVAAAAIEQSLSNLLMLAMRDLEKNDVEVLFEGFGPLSSFASKTEIAYAFDLIEQDVRYDLRIIRKIRNKFAHAVVVTTFQTKEITDLVNNFKQRSQNKFLDPFLLFEQRLEFCRNQIDKKFQQILFEKSIKP